LAPLQYCNRMNIRFGEGATVALSRVLLGSGIDSVLLISGRESFQRSGAERALDRVSGLTLHRFWDFRPNPTVDDVLRGLGALSRVRVRAILGVGGGSAMDVAKAVALLMAQPGDPRRYLLGTTPIVRPRQLPLVLVPTTSGSGSEVTQFATVYAGKAKRSLDHQFCRASHAIVDPSLTASLSPTQAAISALDAMSHALESLWARSSTPASRRLARRALRLLAPELAHGSMVSQAVGRERLSRGAMLAGLAIQRTRTTAAHAFSYPLTAHFGVPHGLACALNLIWLLPYNGGANTSPGAGVSGRVMEIAAHLGAADLPTGVQRLHHLIARHGLPTSLRAFGLRRSDLIVVVDAALGSTRAQNNPRPIDRDSALRGLLSIL
jgi:alcohol dehydrogenase class IV